MHSNRLIVAAMAVACCSSLAARPLSQSPLPLEPLGVRGEAVFPAVEGWYPNDDGTFTLLLGYYNRNTSQNLDIPIGPNNQIEPGGPDMGQPTHFLARRQYGVFAIIVPKDFGNKKLTWTIVANGQTSVVSFWLNPPYLVEPFKNLANGNTPPVVKWTADGAGWQGPPRGSIPTLKARAGEPLPVSLLVTDKPPTYAPPPSTAAARLAEKRGPPVAVSVTWTSHRGPGEVKFAQAKQDFTTLEGTAATTATFAAPGEYIIRATANDTSGDGGGGDQCCWTTAHVKVVVDGAKSAQF